MIYCAVLKFPIELCAGSGNDSLCKGCPGRQSKKAAEPPEQKWCECGHSSSRNLTDKKFAQGAATETGGKRAGSGEGDFIITTNKPKL